MYLKERSRRRNNKDLQVKEHFRVLIASAALTKKPLLVEWLFVNAPEAIYADRLMAICRPAQPHSGCLGRALFGSPPDCLTYGHALSCSNRFINTLKKKGWHKAISFSLMHQRRFEHPTHGAIWRFFEECEHFNLFADNR